MTTDEKQDELKAAGVSREAIAGRLIRLRKQAGHSQQTLAEAAGLSLSTLSKIEQGTAKNARVATFTAIAHALDTSLDYLVFGRLCISDVEDIDLAAAMIRRYGFDPEKEAFVLDRINAYQFSTGETPESIQAAIHMASRDYDISNGDRPPLSPAEPVRLQPGVKRRTPLRKGRK